MSFTSDRAGPDRWPDVYLVAAARGLSGCGDMLAAAALALALQSGGAHGYTVAAMMIAAVLPPAVLAPLAGRLVDRVDSRLLLVVTGTGQALVCVALAYLAGPATPVRLIAIVGLIALLATGLAVTQPTLSALLPAMVRRDRLARANAIGQTGASIGIVLAPALAGVLMSRFAVRVPLLLDALSYLAIVAAGLAIRTRRGAAPRAARDAVARGTGSDRAPAGAAPAPWAIRSDPLLRPLLVLIGGVVGAVSAFNVEEVFLIRGALHSSTTAYGLLGATWTAAMLAGAWLLGRGARDDAAMSRAIVVMLASTGLVVLAMAAAPTVGALVPLFALGGLTNGGENVALAVVLGRRVPEHLRGRAFAIFGGVTNGAIAVGFALAGPLLGTVSARQAVAVTGLAGLAVTVAFAVPLLRAARAERSPGESRLIPEEPGESGLVPGELGSVIGPTAADPGKGRLAA